MMKHFHDENTSGRSDKLFRVLIEQSSDIVVLTNAEGLIMYISPSVTPIMGYTPDELIGRCALAFIHNEDLALIQERLKELVRTPGQRMRVEYRLRCKDGSWRWFESAATNLLHEAGVEAIVKNFRDITERKEAEIALQNERERAELAQQAGHIGIFEWDLQRNQIFWTPENAALYGLPIETFGGTCESWFKRVHPDDRGMVKTYMYGLFKRRARQFSLELRIILPDQSVRWMLTKGRIEYNVEQRAHRLLGVNIDITERKQIEEERITVDQRKDEFISLAGHELKTPLTSLKGYVQLLTKKTGQGDKVDYAFFLRRIDMQIDKLTKLVGDLLDVSRAQTGKLNYTEEVFALDELVEEIRETLQESSRHQLLFEQCTPLQIYGDRDRIGQVLINLLNNAIKYSPRSDKIIIRTEQENGEAVVSVQDFGIGIAEEDQEKVFERFYRVNDSDQKIFPGLGIGLYISHEIIQRHNGHLWVKSQKGKGSTFGFRLPLHKSA
jgi:PAS domain S-box-containing protein